MASIQQLPRSFRAVIRHKDFYESRCFKTREEAETWAAITEEAYRRAKGQEVWVAPPQGLNLIPGLPTLEDLRNTAVEPLGEAVYFLFQGDEVVYVGESKNVLARLAEHVRNNGYGRNFDRYVVLPCLPGTRKRIESHYIALLRPTFNTHGLPRL